MSKEKLRDLNELAESLKHTLNGASNVTPADPGEIHWLIE